MKALLPEAVYQQLRIQLIAGEILPGNRLDYSRLAAQMGVSTTPVREAMARLASEGLVTLVPRAGAMVRVLKNDEFKHLYGVREALESHAIALAASRIAAAEIRHLAMLQEAMERQEERLGGTRHPLTVGDGLSGFLRCDFAFHMTIIEASGNPRLTSIASENAALARLFDRGQKERALASLREINDSHREIVLAISDRDSVRARGLMRHHLRREMELTLTVQAQPSCVSCLAAVHR